MGCGRSIGLGEGRWKGSGSRDGGGNCDPTDCDTGPTASITAKLMSIFEIPSHPSTTKSIVQGVRREMRRVTFHLRQGDFRIWNSRSSANLALPHARESPYSDDMMTQSVVKSSPSSSSIPQPQCIVHAKTFHANSLYGPITTTYHPS